MSDQTPNLDVSATFDTSSGMYLSIPEGDIFGVNAASVSLASDDALAFWNHMEDVAKGAMNSMSFDGNYLDIETSSDDDQHIAPEWDVGGTDVYHSSVTFYAMEKHVQGNERVELSVERKVFEDYLVEHGMISEADCRIAREVSAPAP